MVATLSLIKIIIDSGMRGGAGWVALEKAVEAVGSSLVKLLLVKGGMEQESD